jgi:N-acyl-D-amino-acid deacylase
MDGIGRRDFLKGALKTAAAVSTAATGLLLKGCASGKDFDLVVSGGTLYDGSGGPPVRADIGIVGDSIKLIGKLRPSRARTVIEADGLAVSPGFIDVHEHTSVELLVNPRAESAVRQGVTTLVSGNCGDSVFPLTEAMADEAKRTLLADFGLDLTWRDARGFFERLEMAGTAPNYCSFVGQGTVRAGSVGYADRPGTAAEIERMKSLVQAAMAEGVLGVSSGLEYSPGSFAPTGEIIELCRVAAAAGGVYATHMRDEEEGILDSVDEALRIARETPIRLQISHLKTVYPRNWPKFPELLARLDRARNEGVVFRCDRYPYIAYATGLNMLFPLWSREGTDKDFIARLENPTLRPRLKAAVMEKGKDIGSWDKVLISNVETEKNKRLEGLDLEAAARTAGLEPFEFVRTLLIEEKGKVGMTAFGMNEDELKTLLAHPLVGVGSDGQAVAPYGPLARGKPHPRFYGTFPRVLGKYVREEKVASLEEMIRKMTSMPAAHLGLARRGLLREGLAADLAVFDPARVEDRATWTEPARYPEGIPHVVVNGAVVVDHGDHTGRLPGKVLKRKNRGAVE